MNADNPYRQQFFIGGAWLDAAAPNAIPVYSAATGKTLGSVPAGNAADVDAALAAARRAADGWAALATVERAKLLQKVAERLSERADRIARSISHEVGTPAKLCGRIQVAGPIMAWKAYAQLAAEPQPVERIGHSMVMREPVGVVGCITPWNYPLHQITAKVAAALAAGCTVVLKPSEVAPSAAYLLAESIAEAGLPAGVFNMVMGLGPVVGEALARHPDVDLVSFTGSTSAGRRVAAAAAETIKRVTLELGGKSAAVVLDDADLAVAVKATVNSCLLNSGQTCSATTRLLVPAARHDEAAELAKAAAQAMRPGDPLDPATRLGPLASAEQLERVRSSIRAGIEAGATLVCGGAEALPDLGSGYFISPTVFGNVDPDSALAQDEIFGPVLAILTYQDEEDAIRLANHSRYGLAATVWSGDTQRALRVASRIKAGQVDVNGAPFNLDAPFGGYRQSGYGRENGPMGLHEFFEIKSIQCPR